jgi:hypothetical protein
LQIQAKCNGAVKSELKKRLPCFPLPASRFTEYYSMKKSSAAKRQPEAAKSGKETVCSEWVNG